MIIETDFADRYDFWMLEQARRRCWYSFGGGFRRIVRMNADGRAKAGVALGQAHARLRDRAVPSPVPMASMLFDAGVAARVRSLRRGRRRIRSLSRWQWESISIHFSRAPTGTSSRNPASTGLPPSSEAATIMPFDSMPRSLRGCRLATITTLRPISCSGA